MDPLDLLGLCRRAAEEGVPGDLVVPRVFGPSDYWAVWRRDPQAVRAHLDALLCAPRPGDGLELLLRSGALHALVPELVAIRDLGDDPEAALHKDVWDHTKRVVAGVPNLLELRWGALMHDIGKARTRRIERGKVTFHGHDAVGAKMVDGIQRRLHLFGDDETLLGVVRSLVLNHLRPAQYRHDWADSGVRRLLADVGGPTGFERLMALSRADLTTKNAAKRDKALARGRELEARVDQVFMSDNAPRLPKGTMGIVLERSGRRPGSWLNDIRALLEGEMASGALPTGETIEFYVAEGLRRLDLVRKDLRLPS